MLQAENERDEDRNISAALKYARHSEWKSLELVEAESSTCKHLNRALQLKSIDGNRMIMLAGNRWHVRRHLPKAQMMDMDPRASPPTLFTGFCPTGVEKGVRRDEENIEICARCTKGV